MLCRHLLAARTNAGTATFEPLAERWLEQYLLHVGVKPTIDGDHIEVEDDSFGHSKQHQVMVSTLLPQKFLVLSQGMKSNAKCYP